MPDDVKLINPLLTDLFIVPEIPAKWTKTDEDGTKIMKMDQHWWKSLCQICTYSDTRDLILIPLIPPISSQCLHHPLILGLLTLAYAPVMLGLLLTTGKFSSTAIHSISSDENGSSDELSSYDELFSPVCAFNCLTCALVNFLLAILSNGSWRIPSGKALLGKAEKCKGIPCDVATAHFSSLLVWETSKHNVW